MINTFYQNTKYWEDKIILMSMNDGNRSMGLGRATFDNKECIEHLLSSSKILG